MGYTKITAQVTDQVLQLTNIPKLASGGVNNVQVTFAFCNMWDGLTKTAVFYRTTDQVFPVPLDGSDTCLVPHEVMANEGISFMGVYGEDSSGTVRTSEVLQLTIVQGAITAASIAPDPTPSVYEQLLSRIEKLEKNATSGVHIGPEPPTNGETVWIDTDEEAPEEESGIDVTASVGQTIVAEEVDESGKPTKWKAADYQPRTHWSELVEMANETPTYIEDEMVFVYSTDWSPTVGETYVVNYNGTEYTCTAGDFEGVPCIGNAGVVDFGDDTGEPFFIVCYGDLVSVDANGATEINVKISKVQYNTMPLPYLPQPVHWIDAVEVDGTYEQITVTPLQTNEAINAGFDIRLRIRKEADNYGNTYVYVLPCVTTSRNVAFGEKVIRLTFAGKIGLFPQDKAVTLSAQGNNPENMSEWMSLPWMVIN